MSTRGFLSIAAAPIAEARTALPALRDGLRVAARSRAVIAAAVLLVVLRTSVFAGWEQAAFNSDHAIVGLMAKHLAEGRAFPLFFYGQSYMLGVEAWLAAPFFLVAGPSVLALHLPLVAINVLVAVLLIVLLQREVGLGPLAALAASVFFVIAPPVTALGLVEANGGSVESFLYVLLLWMMRGRPALFGLVLGFGFLHREFTLYGAVAVALVATLENWRRPGAAAEAVRWAGRAVPWCAAVLAIVQVLRWYSSPFGPGTSLATAGLKYTNVGELVRRIHWSPALLTARFSQFWSDHLDVLFGLAPHSLNRLGIRSAVGGQGTPGLGTVMIAALIAALVRIAIGWRRALGEGRVVGFAWFLAAVGLLSMIVFVGVGVEPIRGTLRYDLLGLLAAVGVAAAFQRVERVRAWRGAILVVLLAWATLSSAEHARLLREYVVSPPPNYGRQATDALLSQGVRYATSHYWIAYRFTFFAGERLIVSSEDHVRINEYEERIRALGHPVDSIRDTPCEGGTRLAGPFYRCPR